MADPPVIPTGPVETPPHGFVPDEEQEAILRDTLHTAGIELGDYDERIIAWLAHWDWPTFAVITSWINRAHDQREEESRP